MKPGKRSWEVSKIRFWRTEVVGRIKIVAAVKFVFVVLVCAVGLWLAVELALTTASFILAALLGRKEETPRRRPNVGRAVAGFLAECGAAALAHFLVAVSAAAPTRKSSVALNVRTTPVLLIPGYFCNRGCWVVFARLLRGLGASNIYTIDPKPMTGDIRELAKQVAEKVDAILSTTQAEQVSMVGHSMGGLIARYYIDRLSGAGKVNVCVTIGSPHHGTLLSRLAPGTNAKQMRSGSEFLTDLNRLEHINKGTRFISIWSTFDNMCVPPTSSILGGNAENISLDYMGHLTMLYSPKVAKLVWDQLHR